MDGFLAAVFVFGAIALAGLAWGIGSASGRLLVYWVAG